MKIHEASNNHSNSISSVDSFIVSIKEKNLICCKQQCVKHLFEKKELSLRLFVEEWLQLDKKQKEAVVKFTIRNHSNWSTRTARSKNRTLNRFEFEDPILGKLCRKAFALIIGIGEATLARHVAAVHQSGGRFSPVLHQSIGFDAHHQLSLNIRRFVMDFFVEIASSVGEESSGRHSNRNEEENIARDYATEANDTTVIFLPSMYSLRFLYRLYTQKIEVKDYSTKYLISWRSFRRVFHSKELSWLRIRSPRDDVCDECLLYRRKMAHLLKEPEKNILEDLEGISSEFVRHRNLAIATRKVYKTECKRASDGAKKIQQYFDCSDINQEKVKVLRSKYEAHYSFDFSQSLCLPQLADTPGKFYFLSLRSINLFGIVDDGGTGNPIQTNMLYDQTTASKGSSEVVSMLYLFLVHKRHRFFASRKIYFHADNCAGQNKNSTMIQFFIWCVAVGIVDHIELKFLLKGHTK